VSLDLVAQEERIQSLADMLSLLAMVGGMDKAAVQRVLVSLGSALLDVRAPLAVDRDLASRLLVRIAKESGEQAAIDIATDFAFVARAWQPVLKDYLPLDPHRILPYAEIVYAMVIHSGYALEQYGAFDQFGGPDVVLPMVQLTASLKTYPIPRPGLSWEMVGFDAPGDQALVASDAQNFYLLKAAASAVRLRLSELERGSGEDARREHDIRVDPPLFAACVAGLLGDMLFWAARLRNHAAPGHEIWERLFSLLLPMPKPSEAANASPASAMPLTDEELPPTTPEGPFDSPDSSE
jgi:hypothetical protein